MSCDNLLGRAAEVSFDFDGSGTFIPIPAIQNKSMSFAPRKVEVTTAGDGQYPKFCQTHTPATMSATLFIKKGDSYGDKFLENIQLLQTVDVRVDSFLEGKRYQATATIDSFDPDMPVDNVIQAAITLESSGPWSVVPIT